MERFIALIIFISIGLLIPYLVRYKLMKAPLNNGMSAFIILVNLIFLFILHILNNSHISTSVLSMVAVAFTSNDILKRFDNINNQSEQINNDIKVVKTTNIFTKETIQKGLSTVIVVLILIFVVKSAFTPSFISVPLTSKIYSENMSMDLRKNLYSAYNEQISQMLIKKKELKFSEVEKYDLNEDGTEDYILELVIRTSNKKEIDDRRFYSFTNFDGNWKLSYLYSGMNAPYPYHTKTNDINDIIIRDLFGKKLAIWGWNGKEYSIKEKFAN